jgi:hypothetical protein
MWLIVIPFLSYLRMDSHHEKRTKHQHDVIRSSKQGGDCVGELGVDDC